MQPDTTVIPDELFTRARAGDPQALAQLWTASAPRLRRAVRRQRLTLPTLEPNDLAQEAALVFFDAMRDPDVPDAASFVRRLDSLLAWRISNYLRAERRRLGRQTPLGEPALEQILARQRSGQRNASGANGPSGRRLVRALESLSPRQRSVVFGVYFRDLDVASLAGELGVSTQAITALHRRALKTLREAMREEPSAAEESSESSP